MADELLRGVALVDAVMAHRRAKGETLEGMDAATLEKTTLGGRALTPALRRWLEQDAAMFELADPEPLQSFLENEFGEEWAEMFDPLGEMLTEPVVMFDGWGADSRRVIYLGKADEHGELSVLTPRHRRHALRVHQRTRRRLARAAFAGFLEEEEGLRTCAEGLRADTKAHAKANFGGYVSFVDGDFSKKLS
ncbi:MAG: hypothetical protein R3B99_04675 [Polyangiales bacterium]